MKYAKRKEKHCSQHKTHKNKKTLIFQLAIFKRFNLSYYISHTADAHIDLFQLYKILEETIEEERQERQALV